MFILDFSFHHECFLPSESSLAAWSVFRGRGALGGEMSVAFLPSFLFAEDTLCYTSSVGSEAKASGNHLPSGKSKFGGGGTRWLKCKLGLSLLIFLAMIAVNHLGERTALCVSRCRERISLGLYISNYSWLKSRSQFYNSNSLFKIWGMH